MISIATEFGGPELEKSRIRDWLDRVSQAVDLERGHFEPGYEPAVDIVYCVSGSVTQFDFDAMREREFSERQMLLTLEVVVPGDVMLQENPSDFLVDCLQGANAIAFEFYRKRGIDFALAEAEDLMERIRRRLKWNELIRGDVYDQMGK
jgi:hypothetical protein